MTSFDRIRDENTVSVWTITKGDYTSTIELHTRDGSWKEGAKHDAVLYSIVCTQPYVKAEFTIVDHLENMKVARSILNRVIKNKEKAGWRVISIQGIAMDIPAAERFYDSVPVPEEPVTIESFFGDCDDFI